MVVVLKTQKVQDLWRDANRAVHSTAIAILEDDTGPGVSTADGKVVIDLGALVSEVGAELGISIDTLDELPDDVGVITVLESDTLESAQLAVKAIKVLSVVLFLLPAATALLSRTAWAAIFVGALIALFAVLAGPSCVAHRVQRSAAAGFRRQAAAMWIGTAALIRLVLAWGPISAPDNWLVVLLIVALVVTGIEALRRTSLALDVSAQETTTKTTGSCPRPEPTHEKHRHGGHRHEGQPRPNGPACGSCIGSVTVVLPDLDLARVQRWADRLNSGLEPHVRKEIRYEVDVADRHVTLLECRPPWRADFGPEWTRFPICRFRYTKVRREWSLYWRDQHLKFHAYDPATPTPYIDKLIEQVENDNSGLFWG